jgi:protein required for attachment to host cells
MDPEVNPTEQEARRFASRIAENLDRRRKANEVNKVILAAEGGFLGLLRESMNKETGRLVTDSLSKDLTKISDREIGGYFDTILPVR